MVLLRALIGGVEVALLARDVRPDVLLPSHVRIEEVEGVSDAAFPALRFLVLVLPRAAILWYALVDRIEEQPPEPALVVERRVGSITPEQVASAAPPVEGETSTTGAAAHIARFRVKQ